MSNEIIKNAAAFYSNQRSNITFLVNVSSADPQYFAKIIEGKVSIRIMDFSDKANKVIATARVDIEYIPYLLTCAKHFAMPEAFKQQKIFGEPDSSGLCQMTVLSISYKSGKWGIGIQNGRAVKLQSTTGGYYAKGGSFQESSNLFFSMSAMDFLAAMQSCFDYIQLQKHLVGIYLGELQKNMEAFKVQQQAYRNQQTQGTKSQKQNPTMRAKALCGVRLTTDTKEPYFYVEDASGKKYLFYLENGNVNIASGMEYSLSVTKVVGDKYYVSVS